MTNFTRKARAESEVSIGKAKLAVAKDKRGTLRDTMSNKEVLDLTRSGVKDLLSGTMKVNKIKAQTTDSQNHE